MSGPSLHGVMLCVICLQDATIYVLDNSASVTIDDCVRSAIILGPVKGRYYYILK